MGIRRCTVTWDALWRWLSLQYKLVRQTGMSGSTPVKTGLVPAGAQMMSAWLVNDGCGWLTRIQDFGKGGAWGVGDKLAVRSSQVCAPGGSEGMPPGNF